VNARRNFALSKRISLWDVLHSCEIVGASDSSITKPVPNKFRPLLSKTEITHVFTTGKKATALFKKYCIDEAGLQPIYLPSTSPANRRQHKKPEYMAQWIQVAKALGL
jgi:hypoxanthine-DNA glycosylase